MRRLTIYSELDELYASLPILNCQGLCSDSCGPIAMSRDEWRRITDQLDRTPIAETLACPMLTPLGRCSVYSIRPMICRLWGLVESMPCLWGCKPDRVLSAEEGHDLLKRAWMIGSRGR